MAGSWKWEPRMRALEVGSDGTYTVLRVDGDRLLVFDDRWPAERTSAGWEDAADFEPDRADPGTRAIMGSSMRANFRVWLSLSKPQRMALADAYKPSWHVPASLGTCRALLRRGLAFRTRADGAEFYRLTPDGARVRLAGTRSPKETS